MNIIDDLMWRGAINQMTDEEGLRQLTQEKAVSLYCGVDPTGDSMHIGHLIPFMILRRFQLAGHRPVIVIGGATGSIGDPSGRTSERVLQTKEQVQHNVEKLTAQMKSLFLTSQEDQEAVRLVNNYDWTKDLSLLDFLRDYGKHFNLNTMLAKDVVASRLEVGISFTEFSYQILQSIDFLQLFRKEDVQVQIGGADQWGNITAGLELIRKVEGAEARAYGLTIPLMLKSDGTKFGKSAGGAVWLDPEKTTPYEFYQFWFNTADNDTISAIKKFTFLEKEEIEKLEESLAKEPHLRLAQKALAEELVKIVHGEAALESALNITKALFSGNIKELTLDELKVAVKGMPKAQLPKDDINIVDFLVESGVVTSKRQAREDVNNGAISINGDKVTDLAFTIDNSSRLEDSFTVVRRGKKNYKLVEYK